MADAASRPARGSRSPPRCRWPGRSRDRRRRSRGGAVHELPRRAPRCARGRIAAGLGWSWRAARLHAGTRASARRARDACRPRVVGADWAGGGPTVAAAQPGRRRAPFSPCSCCTWCSRWARGAAPVAARPGRNRRCVRDRGRGQRRSRTLPRPAARSLLLAHLLRQHLPGPGRPGDRARGRRHLARSALAIALGLIALARSPATHGQPAGAAGPAPGARARHACGRCRGGLRARPPERPRSRVPKSTEFAAIFFARALSVCAACRPASRGPSSPPGALAARSPGFWLLSVRHHRRASCETDLRAFFAIPTSKSSTGFRGSGRSS